MGAGGLGCAGARVEHGTRGDEDGAGWLTPQSSCVMKDIASRVPYLSSRTMADPAELLVVGDTGTQKSLGVHTAIKTWMLLNGIVAANRI